MREHYLGSLISLKLFYGLFVFMAFMFWMVLERPAADTHLNPLGLFRIINLFSVQYFYYILEVTPFVLLLSFVFVEKRIARVVAVLFITLVVAYKASFNKDIHAELIPLFTGFVFAFIPSWDKKTENVKRMDMHYHLLIYWFGLFTFLLPYFFSGLWKIVDGMFWQLLFEEKSFWSLDSMSHVISRYAIMTGPDNLLSDYLIRNPLVGYVLLIVGSFWEFLVLLPLFRPSHWRVSAFLLMSFHLLSMWTLNIIFFIPILFILVFLYNVPLQKKNTHLRDLIQDLPFGRHILRFLP